MRVINHQFDSPISRSGAFSEAPNPNKEGNISTFAEIVLDSTKGTFVLFVLIDIKRVLLDLWRDSRFKKTKLEHFEEFKEFLSNLSDLVVKMHSTRRTRLNIL